MSLFGSLFESGSNNSNNFSWKALSLTSQLDELDQISQDEAVVIFKHSTRCAISRMALKNFESEFDAETLPGNLYFLDLLNHRDVSDEISRRYGIRHESPQLLLIYKGKAVSSWSHNFISAESLTRHLEDYPNS